MSKVRLKSFVVYRRESSGIPAILFGATDAEQRPGTSAYCFQIGSVPLPGRPSPVLPHGVIALLFGTGEIVDEVHRRWVEARALKAEMHTAEVLVEVCDQKVGVLHKEDFQDEEFVNVRRMSAELQSDLLRRIAALSLQEGDSGIADDIQEFEVEKSVGGKNVPTKKAKVIAGAQQRTRLIGSRLDLVARVLAEDPDYQKVRVLVAPLFDAELGKLRLVALLKPTTLVELNQNTEGDILEMCRAPITRCGATSEC